MDSLPPDPYATLGITREATTAEIKTAYRKAALRSHPDKAQDKEKANDEFHKIQQAYELLTDDAERQKYDDQVRLAGLRREVFGTQGVRVRTTTTTGGPSSPTVEVRTAKFEMRSSPGTTYATFSTRGPSRYEERDTGLGSNWGFEEALADGSYFSSRTTSRKPSNVEPGTTRKSSVKSARTDDDSPRGKPSKPSPTQKERNERKKQRDKEARGERAKKFSYPDDMSASDSDHAPATPFFSSPSTYETVHRQAADSERVRPRSYDEGSNRRKESRTTDSDYGDTFRKIQTRQSEASAYIRSRTRGDGSTYDDVDSRPSVSRSSSYQIDSTVEYRRSSHDDRPGSVRRSKERSLRSDSSPILSPAKERSSRKSSERQRTESIDLSSSPTARRSSARRTTAPAPPKLTTTFSDVHETRERRASPPPGLNRSETMPVGDFYSSSTTRSAPRRGDTAPTVPSGLRHQETAPKQTNNDSGYSTSSPSEEPHNDDEHELRSSSSKKYYYASDANDVSEHRRENRSKDDRDYSSSSARANILRDPGRLRRSPSPNDDGEQNKTPTSSSRTNSYRSPTSASMGVGGSARRPSVMHENSTQSSSSPRIPGLNRGTSMPIPIRNNSGSSSYFTREVTAKSSRVMDEYDDYSRSPTDMYQGMEGLGIKSSSSSKRQTEESTPRSRKREVSLDYDGGSPASRRASEDLRPPNLNESSSRSGRRSSDKDIDAQIAEANRHMGKKQRDREPQPSDTWPQYDKGEKASPRPTQPKRAGTAA